MIGSLAELTAQTDVQHWILATFATALLPTTLIERLIATHLVNERECTWAAGVPAGMGLWILSSELLLDLSAKEHAGLPRHPGLALQRLSMQLTSESKNFRAFAQEAVDVNDDSTLTVQNFPLQVSLDNAADLSIAMEVLHEGAPPTDLSFLCRWKEKLLAQSDEVIKAYATVRRDALPRVLFVASRCGYSGAEESFSQLVRKLKPSEFTKSALLSLHGRLERELDSAGAHVFVEPALSIESPSYHNFCALKLRLTAIEPDIVHLNGNEPLAALWAIRECNTPYVLHVRNGQVASYRHAAESAAAIITVSKYLRDLILRYNVRPERVHVIYDEADTEHFSPGHGVNEELRERYGIPSAAFVIGMIARLVPNKRHDLMLDAFERVGAQDPTAYLLLKADKYEQDRYYDQVLSQIADHPYRQRIIHLDWVEDIRDIHAISDVLVLCSDREGLGRCVVEAMAMARPVIVTNTGGSHEIVEHGVDGLVVRGGDSAAIAEAVTTLRGSEGMRESFGRHGRQKIVNDLDSSVAAKKVAVLYRQLADRSPRLSPRSCQ